MKLDTRRVADQTLAPPPFERNLEPSSTLSSLSLGLPFMRQMPWPLDTSSRPLARCAGRTVRGCIGNYFFRHSCVPADSVQGLSRRPGLRLLGRGRAS